MGRLGRWELYLNTWKDCHGKKGSTLCPGHSHCVKSTMGMTLGWHKDYSPYNTVGSGCWWPQKVCALWLEVLVDIQKQIRERSQVSDETQSPARSPPDWICPFSLTQWCQTFTIAVHTEYQDDLYGYMGWGGWALSPVRSHGVNK